MKLGSLDIAAIYLGEQEVTGIALGDIPIWGGVTPTGYTVTFSNFSSVSVSIDGGSPISLTTFPTELQVPSSCVIEYSYSNQGASVTQEMYIDRNMTITPLTMSNILDGATTPVLLHFDGDAENLGTTDIEWHGQFDDTNTHFVYTTSGRFAAQRAEAAIWQFFNGVTFASTDKYSVESWIYKDPNAYSSAHVYFSWANEITDGNDYIKLEVDPANSVFKISSFGSVVETINITPTTNNWYHVAFTYHGNQTYSVFLNGEKVYTLTNTDGAVAGYVGNLYTFPEGQTTSYQGFSEFVVHSYERYVDDFDVPTTPYKINRTNTYQAYVNGANTIYIRNNYLDGKFKSLNINDFDNLGATINGIGVVTFDDNSSIKSKTDLSFGVGWPQNYKVVLRVGYQAASSWAPYLYFEDGNSGFSFNRWGGGDYMDRIISADSNGNWSNIEGFSMPVPTSGFETYTIEYDPVNTIIQITPANNLGYRTNTYRAYFQGKKAIMGETSYQLNLVPSYFLVNGVKTTLAIFNTTSKVFNSAFHTISGAEHYNDVIKVNNVVYDRDSTADVTRTELV